MTAPVTWDAWPEPHKKFAMALSRSLPNTPIPMAAVHDLALAVVAAGEEASKLRTPSRMAMDAAEGDPLNEVEKALQACESFLGKNCTDEIQRERGKQLCVELMKAASRAVAAGMSLGASDRRQAADSRVKPGDRQASDERTRSSQLDRLLRGVRNPSAGGLTGR